MTKHPRSSRAHAARRHHEIVSHAHGLVDTLSHTALGEEAKALVAKLRDTVTSLKERSEEAIETTEDAITEHPWCSVAVVGGAGLALGFLYGLLMRRR